MLAVETVLEELIFGVNVVKDCIGVGLVGSCENDDLERFVGFLKALHQIWS